MTVEVVVNGGDNWGFLDSGLPPDYVAPLAEPEPLSLVEQRILLAERLQRLCQTLSHTYDIHNRCIEQRAEAHYFGQSFDESELQAAGLTIYRLLSERRFLLAELIRGLSQEVSDAQNNYNHCILRRIAASALGEAHDDPAFNAARATINELIPEQLAYIAALSETNHTLRHYGVDTYQLSTELAQTGYQNPALAAPELYQDIPLASLAPQLN